MSQSERRSAVTDGAIALVLAGTTTIGYSTWFSRGLFRRSAFDAQYDHGVYRYRVVGRELVLAVHRLVGNPLPRWVAPSGRAGLPPGELLTAVTVVNGLAFLAFALLLRVALRRAGLAEPHRTLAYASMLGVVAATAYVVTPYDQLSYVLLLAALLTATARPPWDLAAVPIVALGVANRESALVAVAALVALWSVRRDDRRLAVVAGLAATAGVGTYLALHLAVAGDGGPTFWSTVTLTGNLSRATGWAGLVLLAALVGWWRGAAELAELGTSARARSAVARGWLLAVPYLVVAGLTGYWFEARLLAPVLVVDCWLRSAVDAQEQLDGSA